MFLRLIPVRSTSYEKRQTLVQRPVSVLRSAHPPLLHGYEPQRGVRVPSGAVRADRDDADEERDM